MTGNRGRFEVLLVEANEEITQLVERVLARVFPEACLLRATALSAVEWQIEQAPHKPRLVLLSGHLIPRLTDLSELVDFLACPAIKSIPVLLLDYEQQLARIEAYYEAGVCAVHLKPETWAEWQSLMQVIRQFWFVYARTVGI